MQARNCNTDLQIHALVIFSHVICTDENHGHIKQILYVDEQLCYLVITLFLLMFIQIPTKELPNSGSVT